MDPWAQLKMAVRTVISLTECASPPAIRVRNLQATCPLTSAQSRPLAPGCRREYVRDTTVVTMRVPMMTPSETPSDTSAENPNHF